MDWNAFFARTSEAAGVETNAELAPLIGVSKAAISHYRTGKRVPPAWTVAACLKLQHHPEPEREAARIMLSTAHSTAERAFWRRLGAAAAVATVALFATPIATAEAGTLTASRVMHYAKSFMRRLRATLPAARECSRNGPAPMLA